MSMGVYICGLEMPKNCDECPCYYETEGAWRNECEVLCKEYTASENRPSWCPLIGIPPHGDLIDRNALMELYADEDDLRLENMKVPISVIRQNIMDAPTIIEGDKE